MAFCRQIQIWMMSCHSSKVMFHHWLVFSSKKLHLGPKENSKLFKAGFSCLKVKLDYLALLDISSQYFEVPYSLCRFFGGGVRRVFGNSFGQRHAGGFKGLGGRSPVLSTGTTSWLSVSQVIPQSFCFLLMRLLEGEKSHAEKGNYHMDSLIYGTGEVAGRSAGEGREEWRVG